MATTTSTGTILQIAKNDISANPAYITLPNVTNLSLPSLAAAEIDTTAVASLTKTFILGTADNGTCEIEFQFERTNASTPADNIKALMLRLPAANQVNDSIRILFNFNTTPSGGSYPFISFQGQFMSSTIDAAIDEVVSGSMTYRISGGITQAQGTKP